MSKDTLYNKYRPLVFDDVKGQDDIVRVLKNQIKNDRLSHAYLFSGIRGTGKTTVARIFARAINCEHPVDGNPCNECETCRKILADNSINYREWNAASRGLITDIKDIQEEIRTRPVVGNYRVYVIDETQTMKPAAVNAFLKTLEEPPEYVVFILCTTDFTNMPQALMSRCQRYTFNRFDNSLIISEINNVLKNENRTMSNQSALQIAMRAEGSMRDALSLLDRVLSYSNDQDVPYDLVLQILGTQDIRRFDQLMHFISSGRTGKALQICNEFISGGMTEQQVTADFLDYLRDLILIKSGGDERIIPVTSEQLKVLEESASEFSEDTIYTVMRPFDELSKTMRNTIERKILLEVAIVQACRALDDSVRVDYEQRIAAVAEKLRKINTQDA